MERSKALLAAAGAGGLVYILSRRAPLYSRELPDKQQVLASLAGGALLIYGMRRKKVVGKAAATVGMRLLRRGVAP